MNKAQQIATGVVAVLMVATILAMPTKFQAGATYASPIAHSGSLSGAVETSAELPQDQVRDLSY
jgi:hypothetical protein